MSALSESELPHFETVQSPWASTSRPAVNLLDDINHKSTNYSHHRNTFGLESSGRGFRRYFLLDERRFGAWLWLCRFHDSLVDRKRYRA